MNEGATSPTSFDVYCKWSVRWIASQVEALEAFLFGVSYHDQVPRFSVIVHLRQGSHTEEARLLAQSTFLGIAAPFLPWRRPRVVELNIAGVGEDELRWFGIILPLFESVTSETASAILGMTIRCRDQAEADGRLSKLCGMPIQG